MRLLPFLPLAFLPAACQEPRAASHVGDVGALLAERGSPQPERSADGHADDEQVRALLGDGLTADEAVRIAWMRSPELGAELDGLALPAADLERARRLFAPLLETEVRFPSGDGQVELELHLVQDVVDLFFTGRRTRAASARLDAEIASAAAFALGLAGDVRAAYVELAAAERLVAYRAGVLAAAEASRDLAQGLLDAGNVSALAAADELARYEEARLDHHRSELARREARGRLNRLMGLWRADEIDWRPSEELQEALDPELDAASAESQAVDRSLALRALRWRLTEVEERLGIDRGARWVASGGVVGERDSDGHWSIGPTLAIPLPFLGVGLAAVQQGLARRSILAQEIDSEAIALRWAVRGELERVLFLREECRHLREVLLPAREHITRETLLHYNAMDASAFQLLAAKRAETDVGVRLLETTRDYWIARTRLDLLLAGGPARDDAGLEAPAPTNLTATEGHHR